MGSKEEKHIVMEFQKKILQEAGCSAEVIAFLDEIEDEVFCEYYCFCFLDGMPIEEVRRIDSVPVQNWKDKIDPSIKTRVNKLRKSRNLLPYLSIFCKYCSYFYRRNVMDIKISCCHRRSFNIKLIIS